jgi:hypothetical protein
LCADCLSRCWVFRSALSIGSEPVQHQQRGPLALAFLFLHALARRGWTCLGWADNLWLTALVGVGSVHWYMSTLGSVWFVAQISTTTFMFAGVWLATARGSPLLSGVALAIAMLGRPHVALCYPLILALGVGASGSRGSRSRSRQCLPPQDSKMTAVGGRFGSPIGRLG